MATFKKSSITIGGTTEMAENFVGDASAYEDFKAGKTIKVHFLAPEEVLKPNGYVPFHATARVIKLVTAEDVDKADAYCDDGTSTVKFTVTFRKWTDSGEGELVVSTQVEKGTRFGVIPTPTPTMMGCGANGVTWVDKIGNDARPIEDDFVIDADLTVYGQCGMS